MSKSDNAVPVVPRSAPAGGPREEEDLVALGLKVPPEMKTWLETRAKAEDRSMSALVRVAISEYRQRVEVAA